MITIVTGTNRPGSNTRKIAGHVEKIYQRLGIPTRLLDLADLPPEIFQPGCYEKTPDSFKKFVDAILTADGLVVITPEYNGGIPGILKYFIDMLPFPESFMNRPVCFIGLAAGLWGAMRPAEQLQQIFTYRNGIVFPERVFLPGVNNLLDAENRLNQTTEKNLTQQAQNFVRFVEKLSDKKLGKSKPAPSKH
jgi:NAD(P)H-dependent FMN reductase